MRVVRGAALAVALLTAGVLACDGDGPTRVRIPNIEGSWLLQGLPVLVVDDCDLDEELDLEGLLEEEIAETDQALDFSQDGDEFVLHGDTDTDGTITSSGAFQTEEIVQVVNGITVRLTVEGEIDGDEMVGSFVIEFVQGTTVCTVVFDFEATRVSDEPNRSVSTVRGLHRFAGELAHDRTR